MLIFVIVVLLMMNIFGCSTNKNVLWKFKEKGSLYHVFFSEENNKVVFIKGGEYVCHDLKTGKKEWSIKKRLAHHTPTIFNNELIGKTAENNIAFFDLNTGQCTHTYNVNGRVDLVQVEQNNLLYFVSKKEYTGTLSVLDLFTGLIESLFQFKGNTDKPIITGTEYLAIAVNTQFEEGKIYFVNKHTGEIKWEREIFSTAPSTMIAGFNESMFFVDMQEELKNKLVEVDMQTGNIINRINYEPSGWLSHIEYVNCPIIEVDEENILLDGNRFYIYNTKIKKLLIITEIPLEVYSLILNDGKMIYHDKKTVYSFDIEEETIKEIYKLNGKEVLRIFAENEYVLLVLAKNVREARANYKDFTYVMLRNKHSDNSE